MVLSRIGSSILFVIFQVLLTLICLIQWTGIILVSSLVPSFSYPFRGLGTFDLFFVNLLGT